MLGAVGAGRRRSSGSGSGGRSHSGELANGGSTGAAAWPRLAKLACTRNCLAAMDGSLALLPALQVQWPTVPFLLSLTTWRPCAACWRCCMPPV